MRRLSVAVVLAGLYGALVVAQGGRVSEAERLQRMAAQFAPTEIRVIAHDSDYSRVSPRKAPPQAQPLDRRGTRRAPRARIRPKALASVDAVKATLIDLSRIGAQLMTTLQLKPGQKVRVTLDDRTGNVQLNAAVVWASFEIPPTGVSRYRAGLEFVEADGTALDTFIARHKAT